MPATLEVLGWLIVILWGMVPFALFPLFTALSIIFIKPLSDNPKYPDRPYLYTAFDPGRAKAVMRGGRLIRVLMNYAGFQFARKGSRESDEYWEIVEVKPGHTGSPDETSLITSTRFSLLGLLLWPVMTLRVLYMSTTIVYRVTGHVFVGLWPFQTLKLYPFSRLVPKKDERGMPVMGSNGLPVLVEVIETSDHVRVRAFTMTFNAQSVETREGLKIGVRLSIVAHVVNPARAFFGVDNWSTFLRTTVLRANAQIARTKPIREVLTADETRRAEYALAVKHDAAEPLLKIAGIVLEDVQVEDFDASDLSEAEKAALTAPWVAEQNAVATRTAGKAAGDARAAEIAAVTQAVKDGGTVAERAQELQAQIAAAAAVGKGGGVAILTMGKTDQPSVDPALAAALAKLDAIKGAVEKAKKEGRA